VGGCSNFLVEIGHLGLQICNSSYMVWGESPHFKSMRNLAGSGKTVEKVEHKFGRSATPLKAGWGVNESRGPGLKRRVMEIPN
jgi:hypothetical protein